MFKNIENCPMVGWNLLVKILRRWNTKGDFIDHHALATKLTADVTRFLKKGKGGI